MSETSRYRHLVLQYCRGNGLDLGSAGDPVKPTSIQVELPAPYCPLLSQTYPPQLRGDATKLVWFQSMCLDYVYSSHLIEDFNELEQEQVLREWCRVLRPGGHLVLLAPEKNLWQRALSLGQPPNMAHKHEPVVGEFTQVLNRIGGFTVLEDRLCDDEGYSLLFVARRN